MKKLARDATPTPTTTSACPCAASKRKLYFTYVPTGKTTFCSRNESRGHATDRRRIPNGSKNLFPSRWGARAQFRGTCSLCSSTDRPFEWRASGASLKRVSSLTCYINWCPLLSPSSSSSLHSISSSTCSTSTLLSFDRLRLLFPSLLSRGAF